MSHYLELALTFCIYPFALMGIIWVSSTIKLFIIRNMKDGWLKHHLLVERWNSSASNSNRRIAGGKKFR
jgi:hypothetical protein